MGYRISSRRATQFRQWATRTLKQHLVDGYTLHEQRLHERGIEYSQVLDLLGRTLHNQTGITAEAAAVLAVVQEYAKSWSLLQAYDEQSLAAQSARQHDMRALEPAAVAAAIAELKAALIVKGEATAHGKADIIARAKGAADAVIGYGDVIVREKADVFVEENSLLSLLPLLLSNL